MHYGKKEYADAWESYKEALTASPSLHLSQFCSDKGYLISGMRKWMRRRGISLKQAKEEALQKRLEPTCVSDRGVDFVEIRMPEPACAAMTVRIDGIEMKAGQAMIHIDHMECGDLGALLKAVLPCSR